jgi:lipoate-protein ligase B
VVVAAEAKPAALIDLGRRDYQEVLALMRGMVAERQAGARGDALLLVEHPEVITLGRRPSSRANVLAADVPVVEVERGGDVTWHGPGQLVGYPILRLDEGERDLHVLLRALEEGLIGACGALGLAAGRRPGWTGVWLPDGNGRKVASIGIAVRRWVTLHGFALNVSSDLARFRAIHPCGLDASVMTSLEQALGRPVALDEVKPLVVAHLGRALGRRFAT